MSKRTLLSRPRTRIYDTNYCIGENMYKSAIDRLDRKYSGRPTSPPPRQVSLPKDIEDRHERAFLDEDLTAARKRAEKHITNETLFDSRGARIDARGMDFFDVDIDDEVAKRIKAIRASKKSSVLDDVELESTVNNINSRRLLDRSEKILDAIGINESSVMSSSSRKSEDIKRRSVRISQEEDTSSNQMTKWSALKDSAEVESAAAFRAKQSKARLSDLEEEMAALEERQQARERRVARMKAMIAESTAEEVEPVQVASTRSLRFRAKEETVQY